MKLEYFSRQDFSMEGKHLVTNLLRSQPGRYDAKNRYNGRQTLHHIDFFCEAPEAQGVALVGDFNDWNPAATPMHRTPDGRWMATLELPHGYHHYLFLVDGTPTLDPRAYGIARNERNERVSLLAVS